jgi:predicted phosphodiesterase
LTATLVVSDLHLGTSSGTDLLRRPAAREALVAALEGVDRLVLLGDVVELRDRPAAAALAAARPVLEELGAALGPRREVLLLAGNHDHRLVWPWLQRRRAGGRALGVDERMTPAEASAGAAAIAEALAPAAVEVAYPGAWLADGVYGTHGHYLDRHVTTPALEPLALRAVERVLTRRGRLPAGADGYEAVGGPVYALTDELAQSLPERGVAGSSPSHRAYGMLTGAARPRWQRLVLGAGFAAGVELANRAGLGPVRADISGPELRRSGLRALGEVVRRLEIDAEHVLFGHTHRAGPLPGDDPAEWRAPGGARLHNAGNWILQEFLVGARPRESPYWAGGAILVRDGAAPEHRRLLEPSPRLLG